MVQTNLTKDKFIFYEKLESIKSIDPSKKSLSFLVDRVKRDDYRGVQLSQHNRFTYEQVIFMIEALYNLVGDKLMQIRTTDIVKRPYNIGGEELYAEYTHIINSKFNKSTQDSIRKNLFVDFHRMGLIERFSPDQTKLDPYARSSVKYVKISKLGEELISKSHTTFERYMIFTRALDKLLYGFASNLLYIMSELEKLNIFEFAFFVSFLDKEMYGSLISSDDIIELVRDFRSLSNSTKRYVIESVSEICKPENFKGDKVDKRDYHNWINEAQQVFMVLGMTTYYDYDKDNRIIKFRLDKENGLFEDSQKLKRSLQEKVLYFKNHNIVKKHGFELHHIVPLSWAKNREEFYLLDKWENMIYIDGYSHSKITQNNNLNVYLDVDYRVFDIKLTDFNKNIVLCKYSEQVLFDRNKTDILINKNKELVQINSNFLV